MGLVALGPLVVACPEVRWSRVRDNEDLDDPQELGAYNIQHEEEWDRRGREVQDESRVGKWARFQREVNDHLLSA